MNPFELLGVGRDADEREIRRAYTAKLRHTRPDDDPEGFQRLHEAYQRLLQIRRHQANQQPPVTMAAPVAPPAEPRPASTPTSVIRAEPVFVPQRLDIDAFCSEAFGRAATGDNRMLSEWLQEQPAFWSFRAKADIGQQLVRRLYRDEPAMPTKCLHVLLNFFDLDHVHAGHDALALQRLSRRSQLAWELMPEHRQALAARMNMQRRPLERCLARLQRPYTWWRALAAGFTPNSAKVMPQFIRELAGPFIEDLPPSVSQEQIRFWTSVGHKNPVSGSQLLFMAGVLSMLSLVVMLGAAATTVFSSQTDMPRLALLGIGVAWACGLLWVALRYYFVLDEWLSRDEDEPARWPRLRLATVPLLLVIGLIPCLLLPLSRGMGFTFLLPALWLSLRRYWRRHDHEGFYVSPGIARIGLLIAIVALPISPSWVFAVATLLAWGDDLRRHRKVLQLAG
ncbi:J domain-containing protein [Dyella sp. GSA-30]|uniref:J domain-containing protein n=1 Tax=Dyella sp. GSA-30 TaxID=2994496 RepID=UPI002492A07C|nr:J domain-containing protein [Dyella sp. GSA-30]BDU20703.1 hypothetical protein DYGSA30_21600 [Dyella sp. GSA-30]